MVDYEAEFERAMEARDAAGWLGTSPAETIEGLSHDLREARAEIVRLNNLLNGKHAE